MQNGLYKSSLDETASHEPVVTERPRLEQGTANSSRPLSIALLTGGQDPHYAVGLGAALMEQNVTLDIIGGDDIYEPEFQRNPNARFHNLHGKQISANLAKRAGRILRFYFRLFWYALTAEPRIFHILWNNKLQIIDRTLIMLLYKLRGRKIVLTAHNVNAGKRDQNDSWLNRVTLRCQYWLADHIFVHTIKMRDELISDFQVNLERITVIPYGINNAVPFTNMPVEEARQRLNLQSDEKVILYFGAIKRYKGLEYLVTAFQQIAERGDYRLIIAGERKKGHEEYWRSIQQAIERHPSQRKIIQKIEFIPDAETETYFTAADVTVLPYIDIFQSGILFVAYSYGLPVIATDVGSFSEDVIVGKTGFICRPRDPEDLAETIEQYFDSDLYNDLGRNRTEIRDYAYSSHSWVSVANLTKGVYAKLLKRAS